MTKLCPKCGAEIIIPGTKPKPEPITVEWLIEQWRAILFKIIADGMALGVIQYYIEDTFKDFTNVINAHFLTRKE